MHGHDKVQRSSPSSRFGLRSTLTNGPTFPPPLLPFHQSPFLHASGLLLVKEPAFLARASTSKQQSGIVHRSSPLHLSIDLSTCQFDTCGETVYTRARRAQALAYYTTVPYVHQSTSQPTKQVPRRALSSGPGLARGASLCGDYGDRLGLSGEILTWLSLHRILYPPTQPRKRKLSAAMESLLPCSSC